MGSGQTVLVPSDRMPQPWVVESRTGYILQRAIDFPTVQQGDWAAVERYLGLALPSDYKQLVGDGPALVFDEELVIHSPFDVREHFQLFEHIAYVSCAEAYLRSSGPEFTVSSVYPEPGGILSWGSDLRGAAYCWDTSDPDPDRWTIVVTGDVVEIERHGVGFSGYLSGLADGSIDSDFEDWPGPDPQIRRDTSGLGT